MSLVFGLAETDLVRMIQREQKDVTDLVGALTDVREVIRILETTVVKDESLMSPRGGMLASLRAAASRLDPAIRSGNEKIRLWSELQRRLRGGSSGL